MNAYYRVFATDNEYKKGYSSCVRIFKLNQKDEAILFAKTYCKDSGSGDTVEIVLYANHKAQKTIMMLRKK